ncbi:unnamed protein product [Chondrus crispus]|uniref:Uncharacterized protein n=1 Tax=Chondrus crispus TaxID=2769 RepID=R7QIC9_CHOCR|nr:unnamed protein product [Chondrus crispus]CDF37829.1 unnamed protein product [Chondrus crispus]|eukprot:XP_005717700.1 unnamed protein product [Chondrus crispus]
MCCKLRSTKGTLKLFFTALPPALLLHPHCRHKHTVNVTSPRPSRSSNLTLLVLITRPSRSFYANASCTAATTAFPFSCRFLVYHSASFFLISCSRFSFPIAADAFRACSAARPTSSPAVFVRRRSCSRFNFLCALSSTRSSLLSSREITVVAFFSSLRAISWISLFESL